MMSTWLSFINGNLKFRLHLALYRISQARR